MSGDTPAHTTARRATNNGSLLAPQPTGWSPGTERLVQSAMHWRHIGPVRGGRVVAVAGCPDDPHTFYFGACGGGVWKTTDTGRIWRNTTDGYLSTAAVGAVAVAPSDAQRIYAGTGETQIRVDVTHGDGVYRSDDGGASWRHAGLSATRHIARVRVHPEQPDTLYAAALGRAFGANEERGIFRSYDGGDSWEHVLSTGPEVGAGDLSMDLSRPHVLFAAQWQVRRAPWGVSSGGSDSGLHRSTDGGGTWRELTDQPGLPSRPWGRVGVAASPARAGRVWALIEARAGGLYRSDDDGESWQLVNNAAELREKAFYFTHVFAHPTEPDTAWILCKRVFRSTDGGHRFVQVSTPHHDDHDLWIDPHDPLRIIEGNDGGACISLNGGDSWSTLYNQPTVQIYRMAVDNQFPYRVYGTQQDSSSVRVPSDSVFDAIRWADCDTVGSAESGFIAIDPREPRIVYAGSTGSGPGGAGALMRHDDRNQQVRMIGPGPDNAGIVAAVDLPYRFTWTLPVMCSRHEPDALYCAANVVFRSHDRGASWQVISPDLTTDDTEAQQVSGGPITVETASDYCCCVTVLAESPHRPDELWAGSDDGRVHVTRDSGGAWQDVTPDELQKWSAVLAIEPSPHDAETVYVAATRYRLDDTRPLLFATADGGRTWRSLAGNLPETDFTRVIRADPLHRGLLYAGTETGLYVSADDGDHWAPLHHDLPVAPVYDLAFAGDDLVAATHGRGFWVLDQLSVLRQALAAEQGGVAAAGGAGGGKPATVATLVAADYAHRLLPQAGWIPWSNPGTTYTIGMLGIEATYESPAPPAVLSGADDAGSDSAAPTSDAAPTKRGDGAPEGDGELEVEGDPADMAMAAATAATAPAAATAMAARLLPPVWRRPRPDEHGRVFLDAGSARPRGALIALAVPARAGTAPRLEIVDGDGIVVRRYAGEVRAVAAADAATSAPGSRANLSADTAAAGGAAAAVTRPVDAPAPRTLVDMAAPGAELTSLLATDGPAADDLAVAQTGSDNDSVGVLRWDLRYAERVAVSAGAHVLEVATGIAPLVPPGSYQVLLSAAGAAGTAERTIEVLADPRVESEPAQLREQAALLLSIRNCVAAITGALTVIARLRGTGTGREPLSTTHSAELDRIEAALTRVVPAGTLARNLPGRLQERLVALAPQVASADSAPTLQERQAYAAIHNELRMLIAALDELATASVGT